jgi:hypothetical protein
MSKKKKKSPLPLPLSGHVKKKKKKKKERKKERKEVSISRMKWVSDESSVGSFAVASANSSERVSFAKKPRSLSEGSFASSSE